MVIPLSQLRWLVEHRWAVFALVVDEGKCPAQWFGEVAFLQDLGSTSSCNELKPMAAFY